MKIMIQQADFNIGEEVQALQKGSTQTGAIATFTGVVRSDNDLQFLELEHYPGMTEKQLAGIAQKAKERFNLLDTTIIHRVGPLRPGDNIVLVVTVASHRKAALEGAEFIIDWLKTEAPFWKKETNREGSHWVKARASDTSARQSWD